MDKGHLVRRAVHMTAPLFLVYYFVPDEVLGLNKAIWLLILAAIFFAFEAWRLARRVPLIGLRDYESGRMSAAGWFVLAGLVSLPFFPLGYTLPVFLGMGLVDPLIGELRMRSSRLNPALPTITYFALALGSMSYIYGLEMHVVVAAAVATTLAIWVEGFKTEKIDDDFTMIVLPLLGIAAVFGLLA